MAKDRREFIGTYECMGGTTYAADYRWAILGEAEEVVRCRDCKRGSDIGTGDLVHCKLLDRMMLRDDYCSMGARES